MADKVSADDQARTAGDDADALAAETTARSQASAQNDQDKAAATAAVGNMVPEAAACDNG